MRRTTWLLLTIVTFTAALGAALIASTGPTSPPVHVSAAAAALEVAAPVPACPTQVDGHPVNCDGYITDGSPQLDDQHCEEPGQTTRMVVSCLIARRPRCPGWGRAMPRATAMACWAPEINAYPWSHTGMFDALFCESKGQTTARNGRYLSLFQDDGVGSYNPVDAFEHAYWAKWVPAGGPSPWRATFDVYCAA